MDYRRAGVMPSGYETLTRAPGPADAGMLARHEHRARQGAPLPPAVGPGRDGDASDRAALELRRRRLALLRLGG
jgi:hypothetical protein